jgi:hypothetical protein
LEPVVRACMFLVMAIRPEALPTDTAALTEMVLALDAENEKLRVAMQTLKGMIFGKRSERLAVIAAEQLALELDDIETGVTPPAPANDDAPVAKPPGKPRRQLFSQSTLTGAINYALNHWDGLTLFLSDGRIEVDTNTVERSMRPIAMGRRNSLFSGSGAESWAILASLVNTAKLHELDPQVYLADVLERIVCGQTRSHQLHELLAWNWKAARERTARVAA